MHLTWFLFTSSQLFLSECKSTDQSCHSCHCGSLISLPVHDCGHAQKTLVGKYVLGPVYDCVHQTVTYLDTHMAFSHEYPTIILRSTLMKWRAQWPQVMSMWWPFRCSEDAHAYISFVSYQSSCIYVPHLREKQFQFIFHLHQWHIIINNDALVRALIGYFFYEKEMDGSCMEMVHADSSLSVKFLVSKGFFLTTFFFFPVKLKFSCY